MTPLQLAKDNMSGIIAAKRMMQQKKREYAWMWRLFGDSVRRREMKGGWGGSGKEKGRDVVECEDGD